MDPSKLDWERARQNYLDEQNSTALRAQKMERNKKAKDYRCSWMKKHSEESRCKKVIPPYDPTKDVSGCPVVTAHAQATHLEMVDQIIYGLTCFCRNHVRASVWRNTVVPAFEANDCAYLLEQVALDRQVYCPKEAKET
jgi:hypothetical protein